MKRSLNFLDYNYHSYIINTSLISYLSILPYYGVFQQVRVVKRGEYKKWQLLLQLTSACVTCSAGAVTTRSNWQCHTLLRLN